MSDEQPDLLAKDEGDEILSTGASYVIGFQPMPVTTLSIPSGGAYVVRTDDPVPDHAEEPVKEGPGALLSAIYRLAQDKDVRMDVLTFLFDRQKEEEERQRRQLYLQALSECQEAIKPVARDAENKQTKSFYAKLETIDAAIRPVYTGRGFVLTFNQVKADNAGHVRIQCACSHGPSGHTELYDREGPLDDKGPKGGDVKTPLHGQVSTETYLQRQLVKGIFNVQLAGFDDDGNKGGFQPLTEEQQEQLIKALQEKGHNEGKFLGTMVTGARSVEDVDQKDFPRLMNTLAIAKDQRGKDAT